MREFAFGVFDLAAGSTRLLRLDFFPLVASFWGPGEQVSEDAFARPLVHTGFAYQAQGDGQTGLDEPAWPREIGGEVVDGSVTWECVAPGSNGITAVASPEVTVTPSGLSLGSASVVDGMGTDTAIQFTVSGGDAGGEYRVQVEVTVGTETIVGSILVRVVVK